MNYRIVITTIQIREKVKQELDSLKKTSKESYEEVILNLIDSVEKQRRYDNHLLIEGYKETAKENLKLEKEWSKAGLDWD